MYIIDGVFEKSANVVRPAEPECNPRKLAVLLWHRAPRGDSLGVLPFPPRESSRTMGSGTRVGPTSWFIQHSRTHSAPRPIR